MAGDFWKTLGSRLVEAGSTYLEQVRIVNELKQLAPDEVRLRFAQYVQGLSSNARAGFAATLAALASSERSGDFQRFVESLRAALVHPQLELPPTPASPPLPDERSSFDEDLERVGEWHELAAEQRDQTVGRYLDALDLDGLGRLDANLGRMQSNCAANIKNHHDNEARLAAGRFVEDQTTYRLAVLAGGPRDPTWQRGLRELEDWMRWFEALHQVVARSIQERRRPPEAPQAAPPAGDFLPAVGELRKLLEQQLATGETRGARAVPLRRQLDQMENVLLAAQRNQIDAAEANRRVKLLYADLAPLLADPGPQERASAGSARVREIDAYAGAMKIALGRELMESPPAATGEALGAVLGDVMRFQNEVTRESDDDALAQLESVLLRPAARARHELAMTRHTLIARPLWDSVEYLPAVNAISYSGAADLQRQLESAVAPRQLTVANTRRLQNHGQVRWDELNACHVSFFDLRGANDLAALATTTPKRASELTAAAYELGLAFALGKPVVVACSAGETMPFDLDLSPLALDGDGDDANLIAQAVDEAFYVLQRDGRGSSIGESIGFLDRLTRGHPKRAAFEKMGWLAPALAEDPAGFAAKAEQLIRDLPRPPWRLLRPAWPAAYPDAAEPRCFHVMPFGPDWADDVRDLTRGICAERGILYRRGDEAEEGRIIHAIWDVLCRASIVLVDLTGTNLNVMIELGMAHAIGRPVLAVRQRDPVDVRPKHIEKLRVHPYESASELAGLLRSRLNV